MSGPVTPRRRNFILPSLLLLVLLVGICEFLLAVRVHVDSPPPSDLIFGGDKQASPPSVVQRNDRLSPQRPSEPKQSSSSVSDVSKGAAGGNDGTFPQSLLVLMNVRISDRGVIDNEVRWMREDVEAVCRYHSTCIWEVNVVATSPDLLASIRSSTASLSPNVHIRYSMNAMPFNKFTYMKDLVDQMGGYDLVLLKDNDQRIAGFPWATFLDRRSDAVISGPLRSSPITDKRRLQFQIHEAGHYKTRESPRWSVDLYNKGAPVEVPLLEMYFVLFDGSFARQFFDSILDDTFVNQASAWGPDFLWCHAARAWDPARPGCYLVPGIESTHEDARQIEKDNSFRKRGRRILDYWNGHPVYKGWMAKSWQWQRIMGGKTLTEIEEECHVLLGLGREDAFDFQACAARTMS